MSSTLLRHVVLALALLTSPLAFAADPAPKADPAKAAPAPSCEHGVKKSICTRCNAKLEPVFKAKGDWCGEHGRPESQCVICNPELAKQGVK